MNEVSRRTFLIIYFISGFLCYLILTLILVVTYLNIFYSLFPETFISLLLIPDYFVLTSTGLFFINKYKQNRKMKINHILTFLVLPVAIYLITWDNSKAGYLISLLLISMGFVMLSSLLKHHFNKSE